MPIDNVKKTNQNFNNLRDRKSETPRRHKKESGQPFTTPLQDSPSLPPENEQPQPPPASSDDKPHIIDVVI